MMKALEEKAAVVSGGNSGIGLWTASRFQQEDAKIAISDRNKQTRDEAVGTIGNGGLTIQASGAKLAELDKFHMEVRRNWAELMCGL